MKLASTLPPGCIIYMDRYFTSIELLDYLHSERSCQPTGTIQLSRIPRESRLQPDNEMRKTCRGAVDQSVRGYEQISIVKWYDNKPVVLASSSEGKMPVGQCKRWSKRDRQYININRPQIVARYKENMGGVDLFDRIIAAYRQSAKTIKWTIRSILHFFLNFACAASWVENEEHRGN